ncbi:MAG: DUF2191 domain-containing protein [Deltaproteobacteria bacterium]|nr:DUF2191 domain-containing protein [Deltaproteobacteria bacterium]
MRTTISIDDRLGEAARRRAASEGLSLSAFIARILRAALHERGREPPAEFRLITVGGGGPRPGIDLDRSSELLAGDDEERFGGGG